MIEKGKWRNLRQEFKLLGQEIDATCDTVALEADEFPGSCDWQYRHLVQLRDSTELQMAILATRFTETIEQNRNSTSP